MSYIRFFIDLDVEKGNVYVLAGDKGNGKRESVDALKQL